MNKLKIGIIGTGLAWEKLHSGAFIRLSDKFELVAMCDIDQEVLHKAAKNANINPSSTYTDYKKMLEEVPLDAIIVCVPISENYNVAKDIIEKNIPLLAEKPFASNPESAIELIELKNKNNATVMVGENYRYTEENKLIKNLLDNNAIGTPLFVVDINTSDFQSDIKPNSFAGKDWRIHPHFKGGIFLDAGVHHFARHRFLFGNLEEIYATALSSSKSFCPYSTITASLKYENNILCHYVYCCESEECQAPKIGFRIFGTKGEIFLEHKDSGNIIVSTNDGISKKISYTPEEGYYNQLINFYDAVLNKAEIISTPEKELGEIQTVFDILKSVEEEKIIKY